MHLRVEQVEIPSADNGWVIVGHLDHVPSAEWAALFARLMRPVFYGVHPVLDGDLVVVPDERRDGVEARRVINQAVLTVNAVLAEHRRARADAEALE